MDDDEEDNGGGDNDEQPHLVPLPVLGGDHAGADGYEEADGKGDLQCEPVGGASLCYKMRSILETNNGCKERKKRRGQEHLNKSPLI